MTRVLVLTTLHEFGMLNSLRAQGCCVTPLRMDSQLQSSLDELDRALSLHPPTSLAAARGTWLPLAEELGVILALQAASAGESLEWDKLPECFSHVLVISERIIPVDLVPCRGCLIGIECIVAHAFAGSEATAWLLKVLHGEKPSLRRIAHVCSYDPRPTTLHDMDVISATLGLSTPLAIEHYFYPTKEIAAGLFRRSDIDILHFECHGTITSLQIDNPYGMPIDVRDLYSDSGPIVYFFLGCNAGGKMNGVAPTFVKKGALASIGAYCRFLSGGSSGEVSVSAYYDALYQGLVAGDSLGEAVQAGRKAAAPDRIYYCSWLLFGNPNVIFSTQKFGDINPYY